MGCTSSNSLSNSNSNNNIINIPKNIEIENVLNKLLPLNMRINPADYRISNFIAAGGAGLVYSAVHHINNTKIAMKFFGYVEKSINIKEVYHEIELFSAVSNLKNIVQLKGVFVDSPAGYINNKISKECYPVICMELMEGGDLFDRLQATNTVSEKFVARVFREILIALESLHQIGYLHCDLKLENVMFSSPEEDSEVKLIDFGMMVRIPSEGIFICETIHGTAGYVAPESIKNCQYSPKSDIWQAGCILYSLLSGFQAFHPHYPELIVQGKYMKMTGVGWDNISSEAKDLVAKIFTRDPEKRPSIQEILQHEWLRGSAPDTHMGEQYKQRMRQRALKQRMKNVVFDRDILANNKETKEKLKRILPLVKPRQKQRRTRSSIIRSSSKPPAGGISPNGVSSASSTSSSTKEEKIAQHNSKRQLNQRKSGSKLYRPVISLDDIDLLRRKRDRSQSIEVQDADFESKANDDFDVKISSLTSAFVQQTVEVARNKTNESLHSSTHEVATPEIDLDTFVTVLRDCGLPELATPQMFYIFDPKKTGKIDLKEFLITMVVFRDTNHNVNDDNEYNSTNETNLTTNQQNTTENEEDNEDKLIRFYFNMFDFENTGKIELDEMKLVLRCIFADKSNGSDVHDQPTTHDIESMFESLLNRSDIKSHETINFEEFKLFYKNLTKE